MEALTSILVVVVIGDNDDVVAVAVAAVVAVVVAAVAELKINDHFRAILIWNIKEIVKEVSAAM